MQISNFLGLPQKNFHFGTNKNQSFNDGLKTKFQARIVTSSSNPDKFEIVGENVKIDPQKEQKSLNANALKNKSNPNKYGYREVIA